MIYLCSWGPDCERVHDIFDEEEVIQTLEGTHEDRGDECTVMTTWHADEKMEDAIWFFVHSAFATSGYEKECNDWIIASMGDVEWPNEVRRLVPIVVKGHPDS